MPLARVSDLEIKCMRRVDDSRGGLTVLEATAEIPFPIVRLFWIDAVPVGGERGAHGHKACQQFLICMAGRVTLEAFDGETERKLSLARGEAVHLFPGIFITLKFEAADSLLLALCDQSYDPSDYLTSRAALVAYRNAVGAG